LDFVLGGRESHRFSREVLAKEALAKWLGVVPSSTAASEVVTAITGGWKTKLDGARKVLGADWGDELLKRASGVVQTAAEGDVDRAIATANGGLASVSTSVQEAPEPATPPEPEKVATPRGDVLDTMVQELKGTIALLDSFDTEMRTENKERVREYAAGKLEPNGPDRGDPRFVGSVTAILADGGDLVAHAEPLRKVLSAAKACDTTLETGRNATVTASISGEAKEKVTAKLEEILAREGTSAAQLVADLTKQVKDVDTFATALGLSARLHATATGYVNQKVTALSPFAELVEGLSNSSTGLSLDILKTLDSICVAARTCDTQFRTNRANDTLRSAQKAVADLAAKTGSQKPAELARKIVALCTSPIPASKAAWWGWAADVKEKQDQLDTLSSETWPQEWLKDFVHLLDGTEKPSSAGASKSPQGVKDSITKRLDDFNVWLKGYPGATHSPTASLPTGEDGEMDWIAWGTSLLGYLGALDDWAVGNWPKDWIPVPELLPQNVPESVRTAASTLRDGLLADKGVVAEGLQYYSGEQAKKAANLGEQISRLVNSASSAATSGQVVDWENLGMQVADFLDQLKGLQGQPWPDGWAQGFAPHATEPPPWQKAINGQITNMLAEDGPVKKMANAYSGGVDHQRAKAVNALSDLCSTQTMKKDGFVWGNWAKDVGDQLAKLKGLAATQWPESWRTQQAIKPTFADVPEAATAAEDDLGAYASSKETGPVAKVLRDLLLNHITKLSGSGAVDAKGAPNLLATVRSHLESYGDLKRVLDGLDERVKAAEVAAAASTFARAKRALDEHNWQETPRPSSKALRSVAESTDEDLKKSYETYKTGWNRINDIRKHWAAAISHLSGWDLVECKKALADLKELNGDSVPYKTLSGGIDDLEELSADSTYEAHMKAANSFKTNLENLPCLTETEQQQVEALSETLEKMAVALRDRDAATPDGLGTLYAEVYAVAYPALRERIQSDVTKQLQAFKERLDDEKTTLAGLVAPGLPPGAINMATSLKAEIGTAIESRVRDGVTAANTKPTERKARLAALGTFLQNTGPYLDAKTAKSLKEGLAKENSAMVVKAPAYSETDWGLTVEDMAVKPGAISRVGKKVEKDSTVSVAWKRAAAMSTYAYTPELAFVPGGGAVLAFPDAPKEVALGWKLGEGVDQPKPANVTAKIQIGGEWQDWPSEPTRRVELACKYDFKAECSGYISIAGSVTIPMNTAEESLAELPVFVPRPRELTWAWKDGAGDEIRALQGVGVAYREQGSEASWITIPGIGEEVPKVPRPSVVPPKTLEVKVTPPAGYAAPDVLVLTVPIAKGTYTVAIPGLKRLVTVTWQWAQGIPEKYRTSPPKVALVAIGGAAKHPFDANQTVHVKSGEYKLEAERDGVAWPTEDHTVPPGTSHSLTLTPPIPTEVRKEIMRVVKANDKEILCWLDGFARWDIRGSIEDRGQRLRNAPTLVQRDRIETLITFPDVWVQDILGASRPKLYQLLRQERQTLEGLCSAVERLRRGQPDGGAGGDAEAKNQLELLCWAMGLWKTGDFVEVAPPESIRAYAPVKRLQVHNTFNAVSGWPVTAVVLRNWQSVLEAVRDARDDWPKACRDTDDRIIAHVKRELGL
ncbi:MAG: hypothetical protein HN976_33175, partial [Lentisphaerae bacterium]|nr:hypothetical protein [Lentisphaerota bacterium]